MVSSLGNWIVSENILIMKIKMKHLFLQNCLTEFENNQFE